MANEYVTILIDGNYQQKPVVRKQSGYNPATGQPEFGMFVENGFDPMTGQPRLIPVVQSGFDPMTGQPAYALSGGATSGANSYTGGASYGAEAGQNGSAYSGGAYQGGAQSGSAYPGSAYPGSAYPGAGGAQSSAYPGSAYPGAGTAGGYQGGYAGGQQGYSNDGFGMGYGVPPKKNSSLPMGAIIGIAAGGAALLAVILLVIFVLVPSGTFLSKQNKVAMAAYQTMKKSTLGDVAIEAGQILASDEITAEIEASASVMGYGGSLEGTVSADAPEGKASIDAQIDVSGLVRQSVTAYMDDSTLQLALPDLMDDVLVYDYTRDAACVDELFAELNGCSSYDLNMALSAANGLIKDSSKNSKKVMKAVKKAYGDLETEKLDKEEFEIDGKDRKCVGYRITITEQDVNNLLKEISEASDETYRDNLEDLAVAISNLTDDNITIGDLSGSVSDISMDDVVIDFYLYKGQLAAIRYDNMSIEFRGGDTRCSNIVLCENGQEVLSLESEVSGSKESGTIRELGGETLLNYVYDKKKGNFSVSSDEIGSYSGKFLIDKGSLELEFGYPGIAEVAAKVKDKANIKKPKGSELVINDYSLMGLANAVYGPLSSLLGPLMDGAGSFF